MRILVSPALHLPEPLTYEYAGDPRLLKQGSRVVAPLGNRLVSGWVMDLSSDYQGKTKKIIGYLPNEYVPGPAFLNFIGSAAAEYLTAPGFILESTLPPGRRQIQRLQVTVAGENIPLRKIPLAQLIRLSEKESLPLVFSGGKSGDTVEVVDEVDGGGGPVPVLFLDSGRLDNYRSLITDFQGRGKSVLLLTPDRWTSQYFSRIWSEAVFYQSTLKTRERDKIWDQVMNGEINLVIGGQSAVLLPFPSLSCIIVERAAAFGYFPLNRRMLNPLQLAMLRAEKQGLDLVLGGVTHTCMSYHERERWRIEDRRMEAIPVTVDKMKAGDKRIPEALVERVKDYFIQEKKVLVICNRLRETRYLFCPACQKMIRCPHCKGPILEDGKEGFACQYCDWKSKEFTECPRCHQPVILERELSIPALRQIINLKVSETGVLELSGGEAGEAAEIRDKIQTHPVVLSTPFIINPVFSGLFDAVIFCQPETMMNLDHFNGAEQLFTIVGEARELLNRETAQGFHVFSAFHFHYAIKLLDRETDFFERELKYRQWFGLPPFARVFQIEIRHKNLRQLAADMRQVYATHRDLNIQKIYLKSRQPERGFFKGILEIHTSGAAIRQAGLLSQKNIRINWIAG